MNPTRSQQHSHERRFLDRPRVQFEEFQGNTVAAYVKLADRKAVRDIQPNAQHPVFLHLDADGWPVAYTMYAPVEGYVIAGLVTSFLLDADGTPKSVGQEVHCDFLSLEDLRSLRDATTEASEGMALV